jgi:ADP-ribose pyrophosphatase YjhB (NUDIX family)
MTNDPSVPGPMPAAPLLLPVVAAALVDLEGRVLLQQRPEGKSLAGLWEFPGGKVEPGETPEAALIRELEEELAIAVPHACLAPVAFASAPAAALHHAQMDRRAACARSDRATLGEAERNARPTDTARRSPAYRPARRPDLTFLSFR